MKLFKYSRLVSISAVVALGFLTWTPATSNAAAPTATLHIVETVINNYGGTAVASDFTLHVRYLMKEVAGSPATGVAAPGQTYILAPGSYIITEDRAPIVGEYISYYNAISGPNGINSGFVTLAAGDDVTITSTSYDWPAGGAVIPVPVTPPTVTPTPTPTVTPTPTPPTTTTVTGGVLPKTSSPWYNLLAIGFGLVLLGGVGLKFRKESN